MNKANTANRQIVLDTETTGLDPKGGHRIIEIGCVELIDRRLTGNNLHLYLQPDREIDPGAEAVHGISNAFLADKPRFANIIEELKSYLVGAELIIHNAPFDVGFIEHEFNLCNEPLQLSSVCTVTDTLVMARKQFPGQRNSLDALCKRLGVNNAHRTLHGALLDSEILADVYLTMTGGQTTLVLDQDAKSAGETINIAASIDVSALVKVSATDAELSEHDVWLARLAEKGANGCIWQQQEDTHGQA